MSDNTVKDTIIDEVFEIEEEKKGFFKNAKEAITGKIENVKEDHPVAAKAIKTLAKLAVGVALFSAGIVTGSAVSKKYEDFPGYDDEPRYDGSDMERDEF